MTDKLLSIDDPIKLEINRLHGQVKRHLNCAFERAVKIGELLEEQKRRLGHGNFTQWIKDNCDFSPRSASDYLRIYRNRDKMADSAVLVETPPHTHRAASTRADPGIQWNDRVSGVSAIETIQQNHNPGSSSMMGKGASFAGSLGRFDTNLARQEMEEI